MEQNKDEDVFDGASVDNPEDSNCNPEQEDPTWGDDDVEFKDPKIEHCPGEENIGGIEGDTTQELPQENLPPREMSDLVTIGVSTDYHSLDDLKLFFEGLIFNHYRRQPGVLLLAVKASIQPVDCMQHSGSPAFEMYNRYVYQAKEMGPGFYGISLEFMYEVNE